MNLALFEILGRIAMLGIWSHWLSATAEDEEVRAAALKRRGQLLDLAIQMLAGAARTRRFSSIAASVSEPE